MSVTPKKVGEIAVKQTLRGKMIIVPGTLSKIMAALLRFFPHQFVALFYSKIA